MLRAGCWPLVTAEQMRALDAHTIEGLGVPGALLMESAGRAVVGVVLELLETGPGGEVVVVCGGGNNGGDGFVVARHLQLLGVPVRAVLLGDAGALRGDAAANLERARRAQVRIEGRGWRTPVRGVVVDAIFGTGLDRPVRGLPAAAIRRINQLPRPEVRVVAVDLPSGLDTDTGQVLGAAVHADVTVTISLPKLGLAQEPGRSHAGQVLVARIGISDEAPDLRVAAELWTARGVGALLPERPAAGHKGRFGHVLVVAGSEGKTGAAALAASGAGRGGAGLVTIACPAGLNDVLEIKCTEAMTVPVADTPQRALAASAEDAILALAAERDVVAAGPGVGRSEDTVALLAALAKRLEKPLVIDADGLFPFADEPGVLKARSAPTILTPHPGEAARLLGESAADVNSDRVAAARQIAHTTGAVVVLKGAASVTAGPDGRVVVNPTGGPALATGGTGDVLTGLVAALLAQGAPAFEAAAVATWLHGAASDRCTRGRGAAGILAGELAEELPAAAEELRRTARRRGDGGPSGGASDAGGPADRPRGDDARLVRDGRHRGDRLVLDFPGA